MSLDLSTNKRNRSAEEQGTWMEFDEDVRFLVARKSNPEYKAFVSKEYRKNEVLLNSKVAGKQATEKSEAIMLEAIAKYILKDWEGITDNGTPVKYDSDLGMVFLDEHDDIREAIEEYADNRDNYLAEAEQKDAKNLKK